MEHEDGGRTAAIAGTGFMAGVKIALAAARFHSVGVARAGPWNTVEKVGVGLITPRNRAQNIPKPACLVPDLE